MLDRYEFNGVKNFVPMESESLAARDAFIRKWGLTDSLRERNCCVCNGSNFTKISDIDRYGFYYPTGMCDRCGNVQQSRYYKDECLVDFYTNYYEDIYGLGKPEDFFKLQEKKGANIYAHVTAVMNPSNVLEVGCSYGGILSYFKGKGCQVTGLDFDERYLKWGRSRNNLNLLKGSLDQLPSNQKYDCIILNHVLEHMVDPKEFLMKLPSYLTRDGVLYVRVPSLNHVLQGGYQGDLFHYWQNAHAVHFSVVSMHNLAKVSGFDIVVMNASVRVILRKNEAPLEISMGEFERSLSYTKSLLRKIEKNRTGVGLKIRLFWKKLKHSMTSRLN